MHASEALLDYLQALIAATRSGRWFVEGLSPRAGIAVLRAAKARALLAQRDYVAPDDVQAILPQTIAHRLVPVAGAGRGRASRCARWSRPRRCPERRGTPAPWPQRCAGAAPPLLRARAGVRQRAARTGGRPPAAHRHADADAAQRLHPADPRPAGVRRDAAGAAGGFDQLPAQPRLSADLPARRQRRGVDAPDARHAARPDAAPAAGRRRCLPATRRCSRWCSTNPRRARATASACASTATAATSAAWTDVPAAGRPACG